MRTAQIEALIRSTERCLQRLDRGLGRAKQRRDLDALTKLNRALGKQRVFLDLDGRERVIGWNERKRDRADASKIRNEFHHQLVDLWEGNVILRQLARTEGPFRGLGLDILLDQK